VNINVYFTPNHLDELQLRDEVVVVIDVLRASTTIAYAMRAGAREVIPVASVEQAMKIVGNLHSTSTVLCGERGGKRIEGFKLGNSPAEYTEEAVQGKALILTTTNGAVALTKAKHARLCYVAGFVNMSAVVEAVRQMDHTEDGEAVPTDDLVILCSGREEEFSLEDATCAGMLITRLLPYYPAATLSDSARAALSVYQQYGGDIHRTLRESDHGRTLIGIGYEDDIRLAAEIDSVPLVPVLEQTAIKKRLVFDERFRQELEDRNGKAPELPKAKARAKVA
jgi:2-phosphosulfolactate phosphatase